MSKSRKGATSVVGGSNTSSQVVDTMTDEQLRERLISLGESVGPIVDSTRSLYKRKLTNLLKSIKTSQSETKPASHNHNMPSGQVKQNNTSHQSMNPVPISTRKGDANVIAQVTALSNEAIRAAFKEAGKDPGPIVATTRHIYEKKLIKLRTRQIRANSGDSYDEFSSDDEDMDWLPV